MPGYAHHITQRGNRRATIFFDNLDYEKYLELLIRYSAKYMLKIWAYCLMPNHIHLVAVPVNEDSLSRTMRETHHLYAAYLNHCTGNTGHLWQGRYYSCVMDEKHFWAAVRYVETNPVRAGIVQSAEIYPWSSAAAHAGLRADPVLAPDFPVQDAPADWLSWLKQDMESMTDILRKKTKACTACGSDKFIKHAGKLLGRDLTPRKNGRPFK